MIKINNNYQNQELYYRSFYEWDKVPYPNESVPPEPEDYSAFSWPLIFLGRSRNGKILGADDKLFITRMVEPDCINFNHEFEKLKNVQINLTSYQVKIAKYWGYGPPTKQFTPIADILIETYQVSPCRAGRILSILQGAIADSLVVCWYYKYKYNVIRPVQCDEGFKTVLKTPKHPSYPAGHAVTAGCMAEILSYFFPKERKKLETLASECAVSREFAGVNYPIDGYEGLILGADVAREVIKTISIQYETYGKLIDLIYKDYKDAPIIPAGLQQYI